MGTIGAGRVTGFSMFAVSSFTSPEAVFGGSLGFVGSLGSMGAGGASSGAFSAIGGASADSAGVPVTEGTGVGSALGSASALGSSRSPSICARRLLRLRARLMGQVWSGCESQGSCGCQALCLLLNQGWKLTGARNGGLLGVASSGTTVSTCEVCGVGGVNGPGIVCEDWVEDGV